MNGIWNGNGKRIHLQEVGTRDGLQVEETFVPTEDKVALVDALSRAGMAKIEVTAFVSPKAIPALRDGEVVLRTIERKPGVIYSALGIPRSMFTVMFAIARTAGWVAHWQEMIGDPAMKIGRPRQLYTGPTQRDYLEVDKRG